MKKRILAGILCLLMMLILMPASVFAVTSTPGTAPTISGPTEPTLTMGYSATTTDTYTVSGDPVPTVTQDTTYNDKIVWNDVTKKLDIAAGLAVGNYPVMLTAANGVLPNAVLNVTLTVGTSGALTTTFTSNCNAAGNMFDVEVTGTLPVRINSFDVHVDGDPCTISVWYREGGYAGYETDAAAWTLVGTQSGVIPNNRSIPTPLNIGGIILQPGIRYGFYMMVEDHPTAVMRYTEMPVGTEYSDGNLKIIAGNGWFKPEFTGIVLSDRIWNGTIHYTTVTESASLSGPTEMTLSEGYTATSTGTFTVGGIPSPTVTQDNTYNGKIVWNNTTKKLDIAAGLRAGSYPVTLTALINLTTNSASSAVTTFTLKVRAPAPVYSNLIGITPPSTITGLANGTSRTINALGLPSVVTLVTDNGSQVSSVIWNMTSCTYNPSVKTAQTFTVSGVVSLPLDVLNPNHFSLVVTISVTVNAAASMTSSAATSTVSSVASDITTSAPTSQGVYSAASVPAMGNGGGSILPYTVYFLMLTATGVFITITLRKLRVNA
ncbi:MAG TPA: hypothetical protein PK629_09500 [Oscillospiraceae bacterium]|nr:hypothetical protein [Oscillospiraceae bacterium]HPF54953.1 hypothetical protein [Clostridiales bacterium]HPK34366.1 hypothetical protein [Oscillospiraceae bacterium]HPR75812.1 hypothetical protein [Oscillospiraceae bacterium]